MFLFQWHSWKPSLNPLCQSRPFHDLHYDLTGTTKPGNAHHARKVGVNPAHGESRKGAPRGRAVPHLAGPSRKAASVSSTRKTRPLTTPAPHSTRSQSRIKPLDSS